MDTLATTQTQVKPVDTIEPKSSDEEPKRKEPNLEKRCEHAIPGTNGKDTYILCRKPQSINGKCPYQGIFLPIKPKDKTSLYDGTYTFVLPRCKVNGILQYEGDSQI